MNITISLALSIGTVITVIIAIMTASRRFGALELKVNTMWDFQMRRAMSEVVRSGLARMNSPFVFHEDSPKYIEPLRAQLQKFYALLGGHALKDADLLLAIERQFGDDLLTSVCIPCEMSHGACLLLALTVAKNSPEVNLHDIRFGTVQVVAAEVIAAQAAKKLADA